MVIESLDKSLADSVDSIIDVSKYLFGKSDGKNYDFSLLSSVLEEGNIFSSLGTFFILTSPLRVSRKISSIELVSEI